MRISLPTTSSLPLHTLFLMLSACSAHDGGSPTLATGESPVADCRDGICVRCVVDGIPHRCESAVVRTGCRPAPFDCSDEVSQVLSCGAGTVSVASAIFFEQPNDEQIVVNHLAHGVACCDDSRSRQSGVDLLGVELEDSGYTWLLRCLPGDADPIHSFPRGEVEAFLLSVARPHEDGVEVLMW